MHELWKQLERREATVAVVGLGYVGLPLAVLLARKFRVIGFDIQTSRIERLREGHDETGEVSAEMLQAEMTFTSDPEMLEKAAFVIVAVPTPIDQACQPDLRPLLSASRIIAPRLKPGRVVVFESTVYPGVTEEVCGPELEKHSGLRCGSDFFLGYSPERINPGDREHSIEKIVKVVSAQTPEVADLVASVYGAVIEAGIHRAPNIRTAEAAKVIENTQRDINIALMNELAVLFHRLGIDTREVLQAAGTKWNFLPFEPGLVGGHCIGVDPYYLTHLAQKQGLHPQVILAGRRINDSMSQFVVDQTLKLMIQNDIKIKGAKLWMLGLTFKENVPDLRNSKVFEMVKALSGFGIEVLCHDPLVTEHDLKGQGLKLYSLDSGIQADCLMVAVRHKVYEKQDLQQITSLVKKGGVIIDIKGIFEREKIETMGFVYWRL